MIAKEIRQQTQPTSCSCVATCIAMAIGVPVQEIGISLDRGSTFDDWGVWLARRGVWMRRGIRIDLYGEPFHNGSVYLIGTHSLNIVNSEHAVLLDTRGPRKEGPNFNERSGWKCFDPNFGREGINVYEWIDEYSTLDFCELRDDVSWRLRGPAQAA